MPRRTPGVIGQPRSRRSTESVFPARLAIVYKPLTEPQLAVLRWIGAGRPAGVYDHGFEHRIVARALERRSLARVRGHGASWTATLTGGGSYYLHHGRYENSREPKGPAATPPPKSAVRSALPGPVPIEIDDLVGRLRAAGGSIRIDAPTDLDRLSYRRAVGALRGSSELSSNERVKMTGMKRGALVVELMDEADSPATSVAVPDEADTRNPTVQAAAANLRSVSNGAKPRALALIQAIAEECTARSWSITFDEEPGFAIAIGGDTYRCFLIEETEKRDVYSNEAVAQRRYDWQRVSPTRADVASGRLRLELGQGYGKRSWADRKRWSLASKLPAFFAALVEMSTAAQEKRARLDEVHQGNLASWEQAVPRAWELHVHGLNAERARLQLKAWRRAKELRTYADAVSSKADSDGSATGTEIVGWTTWLRAEADRIDPLTDVVQLRVESPTEVSTSDLDKFMPRGWTASHPPEPPTWLPS